MSVLRQEQHTLELATRGRGLTPFAPHVARWLQEHQLGDGLVTLFLQHTSASLLITENADPDVHADLERFFARLVRDGDPLFAHDAEGPDDMPAHVRAALPLYKYPREVAFVDELPKNDRGKVDRGELARREAAGALPAASRTEPA